MEKKHRFRRGLRIALAVAVLAVAASLGYRNGYRSGYEVDEPLVGKASQLFIVTYSVGDLVLPYNALAPVAPTNVDNPGARGMASATTGIPGGPDFDSLIDLIVATVEHDSWMENGMGEGEIQPFPSNMSLVISQTARVHEQVADLLAQLRELNVSASAKEIVPLLQSYAAYGRDADNAVRTLPATSAGRAAVKPLFEKSVQGLVELWGAPTYRGESGAHDFPAWSNADQVAAWSRGGGVAYLAIENDGRKSPQLLVGWRHAQ